MTNLGKKGLMHFSTSATRGVRVESQAEMKPKMKPKADWSAAYWIAVYGLLTLVS